MIPYDIIYYYSQNYVLIELGKDFAYINHFVCVVVFTPGGDRVPFLAAFLSIWILEDLLLLHKNRFDHMKKV